MMGSPKSDKEAYEEEKPQYKVTLSEGFWLAETACTQALWEVVMGNNPSHFKGTQRPLEQVSWDYVLTFLAKLNERVPGLGARLPTEAEWEYAARAGDTKSRYGELDSIAWYRANSKGETHPVAQQQPNAWGLYDILGNVWEWTSDIARGYSPSPVTDPSHDVGADRVFRGGAWDDGARYCRAAYRGHGLPGSRVYNVGFRLARGSR